MRTIETTGRVTKDGMLTLPAPREHPRGNTRWLSWLMTKCSDRPVQFEKSSRFSTVDDGRKAYPSAGKTCMTTPDGESVFVDTNVLVYATIAESPLHKVARSQLQRLRDDGANLFVSNQVLREYLVTLTRPGLFPNPPDRHRVLESIEELREQYTVLPDDELVSSQLIQLLRDVDCGGKQVHDANIIATMLSAGVKTLLTENLKDFRRFESFVSVVAPTNAAKP